MTRVRVALLLLAALSLTACGKSSGGAPAAAPAEGAGPFTLAAGPFGTLTRLRNLVAAEPGQAAERTAFSSDGALVAVGDAAGHVSVYEAPTGIRRFVVMLPAPGNRFVGTASEGFANGLGRRILGLAFLPGNGELIARELKPHPANPNRHPADQIELLAEVIKGTGWRCPVTVSNRSGFITRGNGRLEAALLIGKDTKVPVDRQNYDSEQEELADLIADNRLSELAELDTSALKDALEKLDDGAFDMGLTGFDEAALEALMTATAPPDDFPEVDEDIETEHECPKCGYRWSGG